MPQLARVLTQDDLRRSDVGARMDLSAYVDIIEQVRSNGVGGEVELGEGESQRTEKRRLSIAAKQQGYTLKWRKSGPGELRSVLAHDGQPLPGSRPRRQRAAPTTAPTPAPAKRGRRTGS